MMNGRGKSDRPVVATKPSNNAAATGGGGGWREGVWPKGTRRGKTRPGTGPGRRAKCAGADTASSERIGSAVHRLMHHIYTLSTLREAYYGLKRERLPGVDGETWRQYGEDLERTSRPLRAAAARGLSSKASA